MATWNYRAARKTFADGHEEIGIYSVYYDDEGRVDAMSLNPAAVNSYSLEELHRELDLMGEALQKPILEHCDNGLTPDEFMQISIERVELVNGKVVELPDRMFGDAARIAEIGSFLYRYMESNNLGRLAMGGSFLTGRNTVRMPAISFVPHADLVGENTDEIIGKAPTLAIEMLYKDDAEDALDDKADEFLAAGTQMVWIVNPRRRTVAVHTPDALPLMHNIGEVISGGEVLPNFELPVAEIFAD